MHFLFFVLLFLFYVILIEEAPPFQEHYENNMIPLAKTLPIDKNISQCIEKNNTHHIAHVDKQPDTTPSIAIKPRKLYKNISLKQRLKQLHIGLGRPIFIRIFKKEKLLEVWVKAQEQYVLLKAYDICAFSGHLGPKRKEGDRQAPEGFYRVKKRQLNPHSSYHLSFNLGYPNRYDKAHYRTGSYLMVHGECVSVGCYAMTNKYIEEIYHLMEEALKQGQPYVQVHAFPFYMTAKNMAKHSRSRWYDFWSELQQGYDYFEIEKLPPHIVVQKGHYIINEANE